MKQIMKKKKERRMEKKNITNENKAGVDTGVEVTGAFQYSLACSKSHSISTPCPCC